MAMTHRIAVLAGDGVGPEVIHEACRVLDAVAERHEFRLELTEYDIGADRYLATGEVMPESVFAEIATHDAILHGAFGSEEVPDGLFRNGVEERFRLEFDLCVGRRPAKLLPGVASPIAGLTPARCDLVVVRENSEGLYARAGGAAYAGTDREVATQDPITTWYGVERVVRYAFTLAQSRRKKLTLSHKSPPLQYTGGLWQRAVAELSELFPDVRTEYEKVDSACVHLITDPARYDVLVSDTIFGDILSDVAATIQGGKHVAPSSMINPDGGGPGMFEPLHGPAPDLAGTGKADPTGAVLTAAMMLDHLGESTAASTIQAAVVRARSQVPSVQGTGQVGDAVLSALDAS